MVKKTDKKPEGYNETAGTSNLGVFVGLVAVGKGRYEVVVLKTKGGEVTDFKTPYISVEGSELHIALRDFNTAIANHIRNDPGQLWRNNTEICPIPTKE